MCLGIASHFGQHWNYFKIQIWNLDRPTHNQFNAWSRVQAWKLKGKNPCFKPWFNILLHTETIVYATVYLRSMFRVLGINNFESLYNCFQSGPMQWPISINLEKIRQKSIQYVYYKLILSCQESGSHVKLLKLIFEIS